ncbi:hypothetical protein OAS67_09535 [Alphaproteobacteria bacterium]|nr:hypothetical protein [Alphaproteobacteria bacterium]
MISTTCAPGATWDEMQLHGLGVASWWDRWRQRYKLISYVDPWVPWLACRVAPTVV